MRVSRIATIGVASLLLFAFTRPAICQPAGADKGINFCGPDDPQGGDGCRKDPALEQKLDAANKLFADKNYDGASSAYLDAFRNTPLRPVDGPSHGLMIASLNETGQYEQAIDEVLRRDRRLARDDYGLWSDLALVARGLAVSSSVTVAQQTLSREYQKFPSKLQSQLWPLLPKMTIAHLKDHKYSMEIVYTRDTRYPAIRSDIEKYIAGRPSDPFMEFAYFTIGRFDEALAANPNSIIADVLHYSKGYELLSSLAAEARDYLSQHPEQRGAERPLGAILPNFAARAAAVRPHLEAVLRNAPHSPHADDAAFWLGWLAYHESHFQEALQLFSQALVVGNGDYKGPATSWSLTVIEKMSPQQQIAAVGSLQGLAQSPAAWYVAGRSAYRAYDYTLAIDTAKRALDQFKVPLARLPPTTDPGLIAKALTGILYPVDPSARKKAADADSDDDSWHFIDPNLAELPYIIQAGTELSQYEEWLKSGEAATAAAVSTRVRAMIAKYSTTHVDRRQAIRMIEATLAAVPRNAQFNPLREWLYYRKVRLLINFDAGKVGAAVAAMESEFPNGQLMDDALVEQLFTQIAILRNPTAARATFRKIVDKFPNGNALDNAYNWMAIMLHCSGAGDEARQLDQQIIRKFPLTRHAYYALMRLAKPPSANCNDGRYAEGDSAPDYRALRTATIYAGTSRQNPVLRKVAEGARLIVSERQGDWYAVRLGRTTGYVPVDDLKCHSCKDGDDPDGPK